MHAEQRGPAAFGTQRQQDLQRAGRAVGVEALSQAGHGRRLEQGAHGELDAEPGPCLRDELSGEQGMPAQFEEAVVDSDRRHTDHLGEQFAQRPFPRVA